MPKMKPSPWDLLLAEKLKYLREKRGYTQEQVAAKLDVTTQMYQRYESGHGLIRARTVAQLAFIYQVNIAWLLSNLPIPEETPKPHSKN